MNHGIMRWTSGTYHLLISSFLFFGLVLSCKEDVLSPEDTLPPGSGYDFPQGKIYFDTPPLDLAGVIFFEPMGSLSVFPRDHGGFHHIEIGVPKPSTPIYAMADGQIIVLGKSGPDNWAEIKYSTTISTKLGHVGTFEDFIIEKTGTLVDGQPRIINIDVKKGQVIAYVSAFSALDIALHDLDIKNAFLYPEQYNFDLKYASSIFNYFKDPLKSELLAKAIRQQEPRGGKVDYDVKGTLAGNWFSPESTGYADFKNHFAIGYNHIYGDRIEIFDGYARFSLSDYTYSRSWVKNNRPLPEEVDLAYGVVKYEMINTRYLNRIDSVTFKLISLEDVDKQLPLGVFLFELLDTERMQAEFFPGKLADEVNEFSGNQRVYVRNP